MPTTAEIAAELGVSASTVAETGIDRRPEDDGEPRDVVEFLKRHGG
jgi:hypothetical protein